ncbi:MAG: phosphoglucosamine mutase [Oscillospiraceae bacterium]|nr:phosphoglucosamine mutase [Oscillospiraceae bacterium]
MGKYFGTDGIRGVAGEELDAQLAFKIGCAAATVLAKGGGQRPRVMIARDTRISCDMLEAAISAGLCAVGADVTLLGVLPTPAAAYLTVKTNADMGVVISASHNSFEHNGIKLFGGNGFKLSDALEEKVEELIDDGKKIAKKTGSGVGRIDRDQGFWANEYVKYVAGASTGSRFGGRIAIDCANGAATETARLLFRQLDAEFEMNFDEPNGVNINENCGSMHLDYLRDMMKTGRFSLGIAFDGDADRCLIVDELGNTIDGDMMLAVFSRDMHESGQLKGNGFVGTVVSNAGMDVFAQKNRLSFHRANVGDRNVLEKMMELGCNLGGESSGHLIFSDDATTGDGQLTAVKFINALSRSGKKASELVKDIPRFPQVMPSFKLTGGARQRDAIMQHPRLHSELEKYEKTLAGHGRVFIRPSGTEPIIRVLVEAKTERQAARIAKHFTDLMKSITN